MSPVLVGRADQLTTLDDALQRVRRGAPAAVIVGGEAGVGKSRLLIEFSARARGAGVRVLTGGCLELAHGGLPFAPFTTVLRELMRDLGTDGVSALLAGQGTRELARLLPELGGRTAGPPPRPTSGRRGRGCSSSCCPCSARWPSLVPWRW